MIEPTVSIVVLNWNGREHLDESLRTLQGQDYPKDKLELILCDNGSGDGSAEYVREHYPAFRLITLDHNHGFAEGNNIAARQATGEWVGFINNDMSVPAGWLREMLKPLEEQPGLDCIASKIVNWNGTLIDFIGGGINFQGYGLQIDHDAVASPHDVPRRVLFACGGAMLIKRELFLEVGGFDPSFFAYYEDVDLGWRLNLLGHDVWYTPAAPVRHKHHGTANRFPAYRLRVLQERNALLSLFKNLDDANLNAVLPVALLLLNEKALRLSQVDVDAFRPETSPQPTSLDVFPPNGKARDQAMSRLRILYHHQGVGGLARKAVQKTRAAAAAVKQRLQPAPPQNLYEPPLDHHLVPNLAVSHMVAIGQLARNMAELTEKRRWIQANRKRSDDEVLALGKVYLQDPTYASQEYIDFQNWLTEIMGINARFEKVKL